ncbi:MAG: glycosyltransferase family 2 protein [bacterium]
MAEHYLLLRNITIFFATIMLVKYYLFLLLAPFHAVKEALRQERLAGKRLENGLRRPYRPMVSVVIPAWNEEVGLLRTVRSVLNSTYQNLEIIVVNDGSTDRSHEMFERFMKSAEWHNLHPTAQLHYVYKENGGKGTALNRGIVASKGEIVVTVDADSVLHRKAIARLVPYFEDEKIDVAVGNVKVGRNHSVMGFIQNLEYLFGFYFKRAHSVMNAEYIFGGACAAFRKKKVFEQLGLFDEANKTEDIEMSLRTRYNGLHSVYAEDVICYTEGASTVMGLLNQRLRWKKGRFDTFVRYRRMFFSLDKRHNRALSWFILPFCLLSESQLLFEPVGLTLLLSYSIISGDYLSLSLGILFIFATYLVIALFDHEKINLGILFLFPFTWPLFYFLVWVEWLALIKSILMTVRGDEIEWQSWSRTGIDTDAEPVPTHTHTLAHP